MDTKLPPQPRQAVASNILTTVGLGIVMAGMVVGIALATDTGSLAETNAWLIPMLRVAIGMFLVAVILRFSAILGSITLRMSVMRDELPNLINQPEGETR